jgi:hypothetical protein
VTTSTGDDSAEQGPDLTPVIVSCADCGQTWDEFRAVAEHLFLREPSTASRYRADNRSCVFCNPTPGDTWRRGSYL